MSRKLFIFSASSYISGIAAFAFTGNAVIGVFTYIIFCAVIFAILKNKLTLLTATIAAALFILGTTHMYCTRNIHDKFTSNYENKYISMYGKITETSITSQGNISAVLDVTEVLRNDRVFSANNKVLLSIAPPADIKSGDTVTVSGILKPIGGALNEGGFDLNIYYRTKYISARMYTDKITVTVSNTNIFDILNMARDSLGNKTQTVIGGTPGALCKAIMLGDTSSLSPKLKNAFATAGISHVIAVSGMHLTILISFILTILGYFGAPRKLRAAAAIAAVSAYICLVGFRPSVIRSAVMSVLMLAAIETDRKEDTFTSLVIAASLILTVNPYNIYEAGFLLSFAATAGIIIFAAPISAKLSILLPKPVAQLAAVTLAAGAATYPVITSIFGTVSVYSLISNLLVVPLIEIIFTGGFIVLLLSYIIPFAAAALGPVIYTIAYAVIAIADVVSSLPLSSVAVKQPGLAEFLVMTAVFTVLYRFLYNKKQYKTVLLTGFLSLAVSLALSINSMFNFTVHFINVGQGDSALICAPFGKNYVIDTGSSGRETADYLTKLGINKLDAVFISHTDSDHCGGIQYLLESVDSDKIILPANNALSCDDDEILQFLYTVSDKIEFARFGNTYTFGDSCVNILMPRGNFTDSSDNENSLVQYITFKNFTLLFTGDIGTDTEARMLEFYPNLRADVLKAAHHGSKYSSSPDFIKAISANYALIGVSESNSYGHPAQEVLETFTKNNMKIYRTDLNGNIIFTVKPNGKVYIKTKRGSAYE